MQSVKARDLLIYRDLPELTYPTLHVNMMNQGLISRLNYFLVACTFFLASQIMASVGSRSSKVGMVWVSLPL